MTIRVTAQNVKRKWRHCDTRRSRVSQLAHLSLTFGAVTGMVMLHYFCNMARIFNHMRSILSSLVHKVICKIKRATVRRLTVPWQMHARSFGWNPSPVDKHLTVQNVTRPSPGLKIRTIFQIRMTYTRQNRRLTYLTNAWFGSLVQQGMIEDWCSVTAAGLWEPSTWPWTVCESRENRRHENSRKITHIGRWKLIEQYGLWWEVIIL